MVAAGSKATIAQLASQAARGELSYAKAERLAGSVEFLREYGRAFYPDVQQQQRRLKDLRHAGIALEVELPDERIVPVGACLRRAVEAFRA